MNKHHNYHIAVVVCHPDDEVIWTGGMIAGLSQYPFIKITTICLSGKDPNSPRVNEFYAAKKRAGYHSGIIMGSNLRKATEPLPDISKTMEQALQELQLTSRDIDLLISHSPYGDEHQHPHHIQAFYQLKKWTSQQKISFGFFSFLPLPKILHKPILTTMKGDENFQIINISVCLANFAKNIINRLFYNFSFPLYYLSFSINNQLKLDLLNCYPSIDVPAHLKTYLMARCHVEGLYLYDKNAMRIFFT